MFVKASLLPLLFLLERTCKGDPKVLRIGYIETPPDVIVSYDKNNQVVFEGYIIEVLKWLSADLKFAYEMVAIDYTEGFYGLPKEFTNKSLDLGITLYGLKAGRNKIMTSLFPFGNVAYTLVIPYPKRESDPWSCFKPFVYTVWILVALSILAVTVLFKVIAARKYAIDDQGKPNIDSTPLTSMYVIGVITNQGAYCSTKARSSSRIVAGLWCLAALVIVNAYSGSLITYMTTLRVIPVVNSIEEMAKRDDIQLLALNDSFVRVLIQTASDDLKTLSTNLARVSPNLCGNTFTSLDTCVQKVKHGDHVIAIDSSSGYLIIEEDFKKRGECSLTSIEHSYFPSYGGFVIPLNTTEQLRNALDVSILKAVSYGLIGKWNSQYYPAKDNPCRNFRSQPQTIRKLSLTDMRSAFVVLGLGYALSMLVFLYETLRKNLIFAEFVK